MKLTPWLVLLCMSLAACSGSKSAQNVNQDSSQVELSDADEFIENPNEEPAVASTEAVESSEEPVVGDAAQPVVEDEPVAVTESVTPVVAHEMAMSGSEKQYTVQKNETLMLIAFKLYGDYEKWKELANHNRATLKGKTVRAGVTLKYMAPAEEFVWNPQGLPYLIRTGDTLGRISKTVYTTSKKWKMIWENNRPLIKDPNRIFSGFTIYYLENGREVAAEL